MNQTKEILADWRFAPDEWAEFVEFEKGNRGREIGDIFLDNIFVISIIVAVLMLFCGIPAGIFGVLGIGLALVGLLFLVAFIHRSTRQHEFSTLKSRPGEVQITLQSVSINGLWYDWEFEGNRSPLVSIKRHKTYTATGELNLLEFNCLVKIRVNSTYQSFDKKWRVPVPRGKEQEADTVVQRIYEARANSMQSPQINSEKPLNLAAQISADEHDFIGSTVCLNCGGSIEAITHFGWKCIKES